jgi:hypothetical protein
MRRYRPSRAPMAFLVVLAGLMALGTAPAAVAQPAGDGGGPCFSCFGQSTGTNVVYGGSYHVRVKPPATPTAGTDGGGGGGEVADCSGLMAPYQFPDQDLPVPCNDPRRLRRRRPLLPGVVVLPIGGQHLVQRPDAQERLPERPGFHQRWCRPSAWAHGRQRLAADALPRA